MRCPYCGSGDTQVKDSRPSEDGAAIRRRRFCPDCGGRFTTFERVHLKDLIVVKKDGKREPFDRAKLERAISHSCRKRDIDPAKVDQLISGVQGFGDRAAMPRGPGIERHQLLALLGALLGDAPVVLPRLVALLRSERCPALHPALHALLLLRGHRRMPQLLQGRR